MDPAANTKDRSILQSAHSDFVCSARKSALGLGHYTSDAPSPHAHLHLMEWARCSISSILTGHCSGRDGDYRGGHLSRNHRVTFFQVICVQRIEGLPEKGSHSLHVAILHGGVTPKSCQGRKLRSGKPCSESFSPQPFDNSSFQSWQAYLQPVTARDRMQLSVLVIPLNTRSKSSSITSGDYGTVRRRNPSLKLVFALHVPSCRDGRPRIAAPASSPQRERLEGRRRVAVLFGNRKERE
jgi:hypothetical protein